MRQSTARHRGLRDLSPQMFLQYLFSNFEGDGKEGQMVFRFR
jgi:hypothetical protein